MQRYSNLPFSLPRVNFADTEESSRRGVEDQQGAS
jgi:hypothetical protein